MRKKKQKRTIKKRIWSPKLKAQTFEDKRSKRLKTRQAKNNFHLKDQQ